MRSSGANDLLRINLSFSFGPLQLAPLLLEFMT